MAGRQRIALWVTEGAKTYMRQQSGPGKLILDRSHLIDWIIAQVRERDLIALREQENLARANEEGARPKEPKTEISATIDENEVAWIKKSVGQGKPFATRADGIQWCIELAAKKNLKPRKRDVVRPAASAPRSTTEAAT